MAQTILNVGCDSHEMNGGTHVWVIVHRRDEVVNEGLQGPRHQVVVMEIEAGVAVLLGLVQVLVVTSGAQLALERWCLRHVVLQREEDGAVRGSAALIDTEPQTLMQDGHTDPK